MPLGFQTPGFSIVSTFVVLLQAILLQLEHVSCGEPEPAFMFVSRTLSFGVALEMSIGCRSNGSAAGVVSYPGHWVRFCPIDRASCRARG